MSRMVVFKNVRGANQAIVDSEWRIEGILYEGDAIDPDALGRNFGEGTYLVIPENAFPKPFTIREQQTFVRVDRTTDAALAS